MPHQKSIDLATAIESVLSLARENIVDHRDHPEDAALQTAACDTVEDFYKQRLQLKTLT